jgi:hypothetical protein
MQTSAIGITVRVGMAFNASLSLDLKAAVRGCVFWRTLALRARWQHPPRCCAIGMTGHVCG